MFNLKSKTLLIPSNNQKKQRTHKFVRHEEDEPETEEDDGGSTFRHPNFGISRESSNWRKQHERSRSRLYERTAESVN